MLSKTINGTVQFPVKSNKNPIKTGPKAAIKYPIDWAIPDSLPASCAFRARIAKKVRANAKLPPIVIPMNVELRAKIINDCPNKSPLKPSIAQLRSEERRVGKECRYRGSRYE